MMDPNALGGTHQLAKSISDIATGQSRTAILRQKNKEGTRLLLNVAVLATLKAARQGQGS